ncbi:hypothetical protein BG011_004964 [Mortierella polycephala]|uniref:Uncharacterized protein n=1 Tax=Mortierella polycephala TaxID=41804 RepID=A0A9P6U1Y6_9FUNG|nr:hypothetical protein BG011_004964 [Mortierella polycephala]
MDSIESSFRNRELDQVRFLDLRGILDLRVFFRVVEQCLAAQLVSLRLEAWDKGDDYYYLDRILEKCTRLQELIVVPKSEYTERQITTPPTPEELKSETDAVKQAATMLRECKGKESLEWKAAQFQLKTLVLLKPMLAQRVLAAILLRCPKLMTLKLINLAEKPPSGVNSTNLDALNIAAFYNVPELIDDLAHACPRLHTFHLSFRDRILSKQDVQLLLTKLQRVQHWGFVTRDIASPPFLPTFHDGILARAHDAIGLAHLQNRITTLEITGAGLEFGGRGEDGVSSRGTISKALHEFLCTTPTLRHLIAPTVTYYTEYMDLNQILVGSKDRHPDTPRSDGRFWACRSLETCDLEVRGRYEADTSHNSRVIFGYLSKVCPNLVDLRIRRPYISFWLAGGLCLLSRLHCLERLTLSCRSFSGFNETEVFEWIRRKGHPWGKVSSRGVAASSTLVDATKLAWKMTMIKSRLFAASPITSPSPSRSPSPSPSPPSPPPPPPPSPPSQAQIDQKPQDLSLEDLSTLGHMRDIEDLQIERLLQYRRGESCWPRLECWTIEHDGWFDRGLDVCGIDRIRPDVEFRFLRRQYNESWP